MLRLHKVAPNIIRVRINSEHITDELVDLLEACPRLRQVDLTGGDVRVEELDFLEKRARNWDVGYFSD